MTEFVSGLLAALLTLAIFSYLVADNPVYRLAVHLFIGLSAGYAVVLAWYTVIQPQLVDPLATLASASDPLAAAGALVGPLLAAVLGLLLLLKTMRIATRAGSLVVALMLGIGAAVAVGGAVSGTLIPQTEATFLSLIPMDQLAHIVEKGIEGVFIVLGTVATLGFFYYGAQAEPGSPPERPALVRPVAITGQVFIGIAFGVLYAGAIAASLAILAERTEALWSLFTGPAGG